MTLHIHFFPNGEQAVNEAYISLVKLLLYMIKD